MRDIKELVGSLIAVTGDAEVTEQSLILNSMPRVSSFAPSTPPISGCWNLCTIASSGRRIANLDRKERAALRQSLNTIVRLCDIEGPQA